jgi:hypothetical protein
MGQSGAKLGSVARPLACRIITLLRGPTSLALADHFVENRIMVKIQGNVARGGSCAAAGSTPFCSASTPALENRRFSECDRHSLYEQNRTTLAIFNIY